MLLRNTAARRGDPYNRPEDGYPVMREEAVREMRIE